MSGPYNNVLDPQLGAPPYSATPQYPDVSQQRPPPPPAFGGASRVEGLKEEGAVYQSPQPYYYPSPQQTHTSQQSGGPSGAQSNQASPEGQYQVSPEGQYEAAAQDAPSPEEDGGGGEDSKRPRACEACRGLKVRCDQDPAHPEIPCKRCAKAGRQCIITQPSRKRQKKADSRVAELEKKLDALTAALHQQQAGATQYNASPYPAPQAEMAPPRSSTADVSYAYFSEPSMARSGSADGMLPSNKRKRMGDPAAEPSSLNYADHIRDNRLFREPKATSPARGETPPNPNQELVRYLPYSSPEEFATRINSLINPELAATIFERYTTKLAPHLPAVVFPAGTTAEQLFKEKPILYVCILTAASHGTLPPDLSQQLAKEAVGAIADCVVRNGAKSLELIQAMQVTALWYKPPEKAEQTNFYQIIHMAAVMALDIGLGKRFNPSKARRGFGGPNAHYAPGPHKTLPQDSDTLEARRAWLGCYYLCASASMVLRRPNLVRWTNYMKECIEVLESHPDAYASDKLFCQYIKIQHICEDIGLQFLMDDNTANISITDPKVSYALNVLENQLKAWKEQIPTECRTPGLYFFEHVTSLYLHEIALHINHNVEDFRLPFTEESLKSVNNSSEALTQNQMAALEACLKAAHGILDTMLSFDVQTVKTLPMLIYFVRCVYAIVILIKMHVGVCTPNSELGKMMKASDLKVEHYIDSLMGLFGYVAKEEEFRPHPKILRILGVLRDWFMKHKANVEAQRRGEKPREEQQPQQQQDSKGGQQQTPLHLLSQVATGNQQVPAATEATAGQATDWTFNSPALFDYRSNKHPSMHASGTTPYPVGQQPLRDGQAGYSDSYAGPGADSFAMMDPMNADFAWGTNFEGAMDMALGGMDNLHAAGLDNWFLSDPMPFGFNAEMSGSQQQW